MGEREERQARLAVWAAVGPLDAAARGRVAAWLTTAVGERHHGGGREGAGTPGPRATGSQVARELQRFHGLGTRGGGVARHARVIDSLRLAVEQPGWHRPDREALLRQAAGAWRAYDTYITGQRASREVVAHVHSLSAWRLCSLLGDLVDAEADAGEAGERFFARLGHELSAK